MARHMEHVAFLKTMVEMNRPDKKEKLVVENQNDKWQLLTTIVHCADLANATKQLELYNRWTSCLQQEFFAQGDEEKRLKLPVSPMCDRELFESGHGGTEVGFIDYVVHPLFRGLADLVYPDLAFILTQIDVNREWHAKMAANMKEQREAVEAAARAPPPPVKAIRVPKMSASGSSKLANKNE